MKINLCQTLILRAGCILSCATSLLIITVKLCVIKLYVDQTDNLFHLNLPQDSGFESTEGAYDLKEMHRVVNALPKEYKVPFSMHVSGFKYREIAEKLELPLGTVKSRIFFTRQRLQQELKDFV